MAAYEITDKRIFVAGHGGMVGSALVRRLSQENCSVLVAERAELDLRRQTEVERWMAEKRPHIVVIAAAKVGGILANSSLPVDFLQQNLEIATNLIGSAYQTGVEKLLFLGSSCIYPKFASQPLREESLLTGPLEPTNEWYALAKIAGIKLCQAYRQQFGADYISAMPTNLYGPGDNYDLRSSHVLPALLRKLHEAKLSGAGEVVVWGSGAPLREFLHVDDLADACVFLLRNYSAGEHVNVGSGDEISIRDLVRLIGDIVGWRGSIVQDATKADGTPRKLLDCSRLEALGWRARIGLREGVVDAYDWFQRYRAHTAA